MESETSSPEAPATSTVVAPPPLRTVRLARTGLVVALLVIGFCIFLALQSNGLRKSAAPLSGVRPSGLSSLLARYAIGMKELMKPTGMWQKQTGNEIVAGITAEAKQPVDQFRAIIVRAAVLDAPIDVNALKIQVQKSPELKDDMATLTRLTSAGLEGDSPEWKTFSARHGWIADLAKAHATNWQDPVWPTLRGQAILTASAMAAASMAGFGMFAIGVILLIKRLRDLRRTGFTMRMPVLDFPASCTLIEGFAIYLFAFTAVVGMLHRQMPDWPQVLFYGVAFLFIILAFFWPRVRGMNRLVWRQTLGLHLGEGFWKEVRAGLMGWVTGLPILIIAAALAPIITRWTGNDATHPIVDEIVAPGASKWGIVVLAVIWAPITEEAMFRGLLLPGLSGIARLVAGALGSAFIFAVIHPQGWAGVPAIMAIAMTMSVLRMRRGSIVAPMTAHALNNGLVSMLILFAT